MYYVFVYFKLDLNIYKENSVTSLIRGDQYILIIIKVLIKIG